MNTLIHDYSVVQVTIYLWSYSACISQGAIIISLKCHFPSLLLILVGRCIYIIYHLCCSGI